MTDWRILLGAALYCEPDAVPEALVEKCIDIADRWASVCYVQDHVHGPYYLSRSEAAIVAALVCAQR